MCCVYFFGGFVVYQYGFRPCMPYLPVFVPIQEDLMRNGNDEKDDEDEYEKHLIGMYPKIYFIIYPFVTKCCDKMEKEHGHDHVPSREEFEDMVKEIFEEIEEKIEDIIDEEEDELTRQYGRRRLPRDLTRILFLNELVGRRRRRRRPYPPYPGYYPYPGYPQGPGFYPPYHGHGGYYR
jgi:hypothetical protein